MTKQELIEFFKNLKQTQFDALTARAQSMRQGVLEARCEEYFGQADILLPADDASRREAFHLMNRLRDGHSNLPKKS